MYPQLLVYVFMVNFRQTSWIMIKRMILLWITL